MAPTFNYTEIKKMMQLIVGELDLAGYPKEASAMASLTHIISARIQPLDVSDRGELNYLLECIEHQNELTDYINQNKSEPGRPNDSSCN